MFLEYINSIMSFLIQYMTGGVQIDEVKIKETNYLPTPDAFLFVDGGLLLSGF